MRGFIHLLLLFFFISCTAIDNNSNEKYFYTLCVSNDTCIYSNDKHVAFTSLIKYKGDVYLAFREAVNHVPTNKAEYGIIRVLKKEDNNWTPLFTLRNQNMDLRDPFFIVKNDHLRIYCGYNQFVGESSRYQHSGTAYSDFIDGSWSDFKIVRHDASHIVWIWKIREYKDQYYGVGYLEGYKPILFISDDGEKWETINELDVEGIVSEADLNFIGDSLYICLRKDEPTGSPSYWGKSIYPFKSVEWSVMNKSIACPEFFFLPKSYQMWLVGREYFTDESGKIFSVAITCNEVSTNGILSNPLKINEGEGWDKGYPSILWDNKNLYISYYCIDNNTSQIRLQTLNLFVK